jgi:Cupredoxin-like domain
VKPAIALAASFGLAALVAACGSPPAPYAGPGMMNPFVTSSNLPFPDTGSRLGTVEGAQVITFKVVGASEGAMGPDGRRHDTFTATSATAVVAGRPVTVEVTNFDEMPHSFTIPQLGIDRLVPPGADGNPGKVTFTFTPAVSGTYRWFCALPCDDDNGYWAMGTYGHAGGGMMGAGVGGAMMEPGVDGFMAGYITVSAG